VRAEASHPDADTLTAYVEQLLPASERKQILEHVAACSHCREVMALAMFLPGPDGLDTAEVAVAAPATPRWRFFSWNPRLGFAASLAVLAVAATVVLVMPKKASAPVEQAKNDITPPSGVPPASAVQPAVTLPPALEDSLTTRATRMPTAGSSSLRASARRDAPTADRLSLASPVDANGAIAPMPPSTNHLPGITEAYDRVAPERRRDYLNNEILATNSTFSVNGQPSDVSVIAAPSSNQDLFQKSLSNAKVPLPFSDLPPPSQDVKTSHISASPSRFGFVIFGSLGRETRQLLHARTSPPIPPNISGFAAMGPSSQLSPLKEKNQTAEVAAAPATAQKDASELDQQSGAFTFNNRARAEASLAKADKKAESSPISWKTNEGQLLKCGSATACVEGYPSNEGIAFSIVRSRGSEIWAGGNDAALVHSHDGGVTWDRITLGASAKGTITGIDARGSNVQVQSSSGQSWSSRDGGKSWTLQE
jgi:hypothetical protein